jgi:DNA-binding response OmpR family regulator
MADLKRILYVDDDQDFLDGMRVVLEAGGYEMLEAHGAEEGLLVFRREHPDAVLVDLMMEEIDSGTGLVRELKFDGSTLPVFLVSSVGESLAMNIAPSELGLAGVFQKPIDPASLLATLRSKLG